MSSLSLSSSLQRLRTGLVHPPVEVVWASHSSWPLPNPSRLPSRPSPEKIQISVLDSSFNPPTLAHFALAEAPAPSSLRASESQDHRIDSNSGYDAKLLLLSVRNADKQLKPNDATYVQRLEMMIELAKDLQEKDIGESASSSADIAVAIIDEPTFVGKSRLLRVFLKERLRLQMQALSKDSVSLEADKPAANSFATSSPGVQLTFLLGYDTLERLFSPKYYDSSQEMMYQALQGFFAPPSPNETVSEPRGELEGDGSRVVCARRSPSSYPHAAIGLTNHSLSSTTSSTSESHSHSLSHTISTFLASSSLPSSCITMIDIGEDVWNVSSSEVRERVREGSRTTEMEGQRGTNLTEVEGSSRAEGIQWKNMVSERVKRYIAECGLYK
ncbi:hypothetical protein BT96DRAFT_919855 [Gymnopus androsaceus JB14]|uniref:Nucleotidylyl transferase n=1 Tax=Gymnopus androsaceus JB14 TaxID=1447944 RepID=A0A6A4HS73_9AGAR|nr:hypothetical protein BT96DRAFT_919855 [Gymnopus androsaceus JB14]